MLNPLTGLRMMVGVPRQVARDLHAVAQAARAIPDIARALAALASVIERLQTAADLDDEVEVVREVLRTLRCLPQITEAVRNLPAIEEAVLALTAALEPALADVRRVRELADAQGPQVAHVEQMLQAIEQRSAVLERVILDLKAQADEAMRVLPDPDDGRGAIAKARDVFTGAS